MVEIFGYEAEELVDKIDPRDLVLEEDWPTVRDNLRKRLSNEQRAIHYEFRGVRKDKRIVYVEVFGSRTVIQGKPAVLGTLLDITERKRGEEEIRRLNEELQQKIVQLQEAQEELVRKEKLAILGQLSGSIGHELRNPLGVMSNAIYFLNMVLTGADKTVKEYLGMPLTRQLYAHFPDPIFLSNILSFERIPARITQAHAKKIAVPIFRLFFD